MKNIQQIATFSNSDIAKFRVKVLEFHSRYGSKATQEAFDVGKSTIYRWRKAYKDSLKNVLVLIPKTTRPKNLRISMTDLRIVEEIQRIRRKPPILGKEKIKILLDEFCDNLSIEKISVSTIGKIIKKKCSKISSNGRIYHNPNNARASKRVSYKYKVKKSPKVSESGYVEIDTIVRFVLGIKVYVFNAVDIYSRFQFSYGYTNLNSRTSTDFFQKLERIYPFPNGIKIVQTDNGSEYLGEFDKYLHHKSLKHLYIYPRCPKINGYVERANRTLDEDFLKWNIQLASRDLNRFNEKLIDHLIWFNTKRPHSSLSNQSPVNYLLSKYPESQMYVTYTKY